MVCLRINFAVNRTLGDAGDRFTQQPTMTVQLGALRMPTLVIHGACDPRPARVAQGLAQSIPDATYVELPNVGHLPWIEQPDVLRGALRLFLTQFV
jgi:proline iminopeptidase